MKLIRKIDPSNGFSAKSGIHNIQKCTVRTLKLFKYKRETMT